MLLLSIKHRKNSNTTEWKNALAKSPIHFQWDPDREPLGNALTRRAIQFRSDSFATPLSNPLILHVGIS